MKVNTRSLTRVKLKVCTGKLKTQKVHRLVAKAFLVKEDYQKEVNHLDKDVTNNTIDNLEWSNFSEYLPW